MLSVLKSRRARIAFGHDVFMAAVSFPLALYLRTGDWMIYLARDYLWQGTVLFAGVAALVFFMSGLYRGIWRYASTADLVAITKAVTLAILLFLPVLFLLTRLEQVPRSLPIINWFVLMALLGGPRFLYRILKDRRLDNVLAPAGTPRIPVLLVGAGDAAELFLRDIRRDRGSPYVPIGILDEKDTRVGRQIHGVSVLGTLDDIEMLLTGGKLAEKPQKLILTKSDPSPELIRQVTGHAERLGLSVSRLPRLSELKQGAGGLAQVEIRPIAVEDLLGRPQQKLDIEAMRRLIADKRVLVTGAGGSIGSEIARQAADFGPARLALFDASEYLLYQIDMALSESHPNLTLEAFLGDVRDRTRVEQVMREFAPEIVLHAAALKHVPMVEHNPVEGVLTNVIGSRIVADACRAAGVGCMVQISTDKAVNPTNVMGATKRLAEAYIQALDPVSRAAGETRYVAVRFGNVLGSTGSVVPLFTRQLAAGGPLTVTHPDITRYFMTVREAVELVLQASAVGVEDSEAAGRIFVLDMGAPIKVLDLARQMIHLAGLRPDDDIKIEFTGLRPGEKLYEELLHGEEALLPSRAPGTTLAAPRTGALPDLKAALDELEAAARNRSGSDVLNHLAALVPEFELSDATRARANSPVAPNDAESPAALRAD